MEAIKLTFLLILLISGLTKAQQRGLFEFREFHKAINDQTRTKTWEPGSGYWLNYSDYKLEAYIDASKYALSGKGSIIYHNNSPAALKDIHFRLYQDLYKPGTARLEPIPLQFEKDCYQEIYSHETPDSLHLCFCSFNVMPRK